MNNVLSVWHARLYGIGPDALVAPPVAAIVQSCMALLHAHAAGTLPGGGHFVAGSGSIIPCETTLKINQSSGRGVVNWDSFSIGNNNRVVFADGSGATLNRITGGVPSAILRTLTASGSVCPSNPQGRVIGPDGVVTTNGRFFASTLDAELTALINGQPPVLADSSDSGVVNLRQGRLGRLRRVSDRDRRAQRTPC